MTRWLSLMAALLLGVAAAQPQLTPYESASLAYRISYPSDWTLTATPDGDYLVIHPPELSEAHGRVAIELAVEEPWHESIEAAVDEFLLELRENLVPDLQVLSRVGIINLGTAAIGLDVRGTDMTGQNVTFRIVVALHEERVYGLFLEAVSAEFAAYEPLFDRVQASFTLLDAGQPEPVEPAAFGGTFESDELTLSIEPSPVGGLAPGVQAFEGTLRFGDQSFPVTATHDARAPHLKGSFESAGSRFDFTASLLGDTLTFATGGVSYVLTRQVEELPEPPCNPLVPGSCSEPEPEPPCNPLVPGSCDESPRSEPDYMEGVAASVRGDYTIAYDVFLPLAKHGHLGAQFELAKMYFEGRGTAQDYEEALRWYRLAAEQRLPAAQHNVGSMYERGLGVTQDHAEALRWYRLAAEQGFPPALEAIERLAGAN